MYYREYENQKNWVIELLVQQGVALIEKQVLEKIRESSGSEEKSAPIRYITLSEEVRQVYRALQKWIDLTDEKVNFFFR
jgi:hypothetical protein